MVDGAVATVDRFEEQRLLQRRRATLQTSCHTWRTAAVMTLFLSPLGWLFGLVALFLMRGLGACIESDRQYEAEEKLHAARSVLVVGAVVAGLSLLVSGFFAFQMMRGVLSAHWDAFGRGASGDIP